MPFSGYIFQCKKKIIIIIIKVTMCARGYAGTCNNSAAATKVSGPRIVDHRFKRRKLMWWNVV
jgi:hypothetical protein